MGGVVYILTNEAMPDLCKIGWTENLKQRLQSLNNTSVPSPFNIYYAAEVENGRKDESWLHSIFDDRRYRKNREFFEVDPERVVVALKRIEIKDVTPKTLEESLVGASEEKKKEVEKKLKIRSKFDFEKYAIPIGSEVVFSRDPSIRAKVLANNKIELNGKETSLSKAAQELLGYSSVAGTLYWRYQDESLDERRRRIEAGEEFTQKEIDAAGDAWMDMQNNIGRGR